MKRCFFYILSSVVRPSLFCYSLIFPLSTICVTKPSKEFDCKHNREIYILWIAPYETGLNVRLFTIIWNSFKYKTLQPNIYKVWNFISVQKAYCCNLLLHWNKKITTDLIWLIFICMYGNNFRAKSWYWLNNMLVLK